MTLFVFSYGLLSGVTLGAILSRVSGKAPQATINAGLVGMAIGAAMLVYLFAVPV